MALDSDELRRRIVAGRVLLGMTQDEMAAIGHEEWGLGKGELARAERGSSAIQPYHLRVLVEILDVPMSWFTEPREAIVSQHPKDLQGVLGEIEQWLRAEGPGGEERRRTQS